MQLPVLQDPQQETYRDLIRVVVNPESLYVH